MFHNLFFQNFFCQNFFPKIFFPKFLFQIFCAKFFFQNYFLNIFFQNVCFKNFFQLFFKIFLLRASLSMAPRLQRQNGLYVFVLWKIWYTKRSKLDFSLVWYSSSIHTAHITLEVKSSISSPQRIIDSYIFFRICYI